jgi:hypothetical protein
MKLKGVAHSAEMKPKMQGGIDRMQRHKMEKSMCEFDFHGFRRNIDKLVKAENWLPLGSKSRPHCVRKLISMFSGMTNWTKQSAPCVPQILAALHYEHLTYELGKSSSRVVAGPNIKFYR